MNGNKVGGRRPARIASAVISLNRCRLVQAASPAVINPLRQEILRQLECLSERAPELRFGQMVADLAFLAKGPWDETLWDLEDEELLAAIQQQLSDLSHREHEAAR
jgi:hypothetical protein